ncbi:hypothetical protein PHPALM_28396 [Phytophthora palmivora]|uniref:Uncharacterized protein n=1 Tax=Phytophthora palmivora TaxID=4796 RepID=A0A2P4XA83_9STRA|nr:hypothetical protein PHPALM_28396 [Phytophthora palmivora]
MRKTKHCFIRLSHVLFLDRFAERLAHSDDALTRDQIEAGAVNVKTVFWKEVGVEHRTNKRDYNNLFEAAASDPRFSGINPSYIVQYDDSRLYDMWKKGKSSFVKANAKFYVSGQNSEDFYEFCDGNLDAACLEICTIVKPELAAFVRGEDEIDSMNLPGSHSDVPANKSAKWQDQVIRTVNRLADIFVGTPVTVSSARTRSTEAERRDEDQLIDRIGKMHLLIEQVKERQRKDALSGTTDPTLAVSLRKYLQRLQRYEDQLDGQL